MKEFQWNKKGLIYQVSNSNSFLLTHASNPLALHLNDDVYRIFYSGRDADNRSSVSYLDYDLLKEEIVYDHRIPIISPKINTFYSHGITIGNYWYENNEIFVGFMGWQQKEGCHWRGDIGKFNLNTGKITLLMGTSEEDPISLSYPHISYENGIYRMWYGSTISWDSPNGEMIHIIKEATTTNMKTWDHKGCIIPYEIGVAQAFSKPCVLKNKDGYRMWYSYRDGIGTPYRIGYAYSKTGNNWKVKKSNLNVSVNGWDSDMVCYPYVFEHKAETYMLYNGNRYGLEGFGLAKGV
jgi:hypothetical protein